MSEARKTPQSHFTGPVVIDPLTRIEGHLRIEVEVKDGRVSEARSVGTLYPVSYTHLPALRGFFVSAAQGPPRQNGPERLPRPVFYSANSSLMMLAFQTTLSPSGSRVRPGAFQQDVYKRQPEEAGTLPGMFDEERRSGRCPPRKAISD